GPPLLSSHYRPLPSPDLGPITSPPNYGPSIFLPDSGPSLLSSNYGPLFILPESGPIISSPKFGPIILSNSGPSSFPPNHGRLQFQSFSFPSHRGLLFSVYFFSSTQS